MPKDERDKIIAACNAARKAKKSGGGGGGDGSGSGGNGKARKRNPKQTKWMKKEINRLVANAMTVREKVNDDEEEGEVAMKTEDGNGHKMRQSNKKKSGNN